MSRKTVQVSSTYEAKDGSKKWRNAIVGSAWVMENGEISIRLDPGISIASIEGVRITIKEPFDRDAPMERKNAQKPAQKPAKIDDDIPF